MKFADELFIGNSIGDVSLIVEMLRKRELPYGVFCVCKNDESKFMYEILSCKELLKERNYEIYTIFGIAAGKREAFEVLREMVEENHEYM